MPMRIFIAYISVVSVISVVVTVADKIKARYGAWRIRERTLFLISALGGSVAMYLTMLIIRHKTKHASFMIGIPAIIAIQAVIAFTVFF